MPAPLSAVHSPILYTFVVSVSVISDISSIVGASLLAVVSAVDSAVVSVVGSGALVGSAVLAFSVDDFASVSRLETAVSNFTMVASFADTSLSRVEI